MIAVQEEDYEGKYEYVVPEKAHGHSTPKNRFSKHLKLMSEQELQALTDELKKV